MHGYHCDSNNINLRDAYTMAASQNIILLETTVWLDRARSYYKLIFSTDDDYCELECITCVRGDADVYRIDLRVSW